MASESYPLWLADTDMPEFLEHPVTIVEASGVTLVDTTGNTYVDLFSGNWNVPLGYSQQSIIDAITDQLNKLPFAKASSFATEPSLKLSQVLADIVPVDSPRCYFCNSGSEAVETALKMVRQRAFLQGSKKKKVIVLEQAYHGQTLAALSASGIEWCQEPFTPLMDGFLRIAIPRHPEDVAQLESVLANNPDVGAVLIEPLLAVGGVTPLPVGFLERLRKLCDQHDILLVCDEITTGFGRCGNWFMSESAKPDILLLGKGLTNGYLPLSVAVASRKVWEVFDARGSMRHGQTNTNHPVCAAAGVATLELMMGLDAPQLCHDKSEMIFDALKPLMEAGNIAAMRGKGLLMALEVDMEIHRRMNSRKWLQQGLLRSGYLAGQIDNVLILAPPFIVEESHVEGFVSKLRALF